MIFLLCFLCFYRFIGIFTQNSSQQLYAANYNEDNSEPGYESLPDQSSSLSNDPGYETVEQSHEKNPMTKNGSDYDPNYETLRPTTNKSTTPSPTKLNDGYSSIKLVKNKIINSEDDDGAVGYCTISDDTHATNLEHRNHDYASIREATKEQNEEDIYSSISHEIDDISPNKSNKNT